MKSRTIIPFTAGTMLLAALVGCSGVEERADAAWPAGASGVGEILLESGLADAELGSPVRVANLTVWPVHGRERVELADVLTLGEAQAQGLVEIRELAADENPVNFIEGLEGGGAQVNRLEIENRGARPVLVCAGTVVQGGKQDRQVGVDTLILAESTATIEAFCVESQRWTAQRDGVATGGLFLAADTMAMKKVRASGQYLADQGEVWSNVAMMNHRASKSAPTSSLSATIDESDEEVKALRGAIESAVREHFARARADGRAVLGFAYAINGEPITLRTFATSDLFERSFPPFLRTMCLESELIQRRDSAEGRDAFERTASAEALHALLRGIAGGEETERETPSGARLRIQSNDWGGRTECLVPVNTAEGSRWVSCTQDWTAAVEFGNEAAEALRSLSALGYS